jgi:hypothetical protein
VAVERAANVIARNGASFSSLPICSFDFQSFFKKRSELQGRRGQDLVTERADFLGGSNGPPQIRAPPAIELALWPPPTLVQQDTGMWLSWTQKNYATATVGFLHGGNGQ